MGRYSKIKQSQKDLEGKNDSKIQSNKLQKCITKIRKSEIGKPSFLNSISLQIPNIWSSNYILVNIVSFFIDEGRHFLLHLAGAKRKSEKEKDILKKQQQLKKQIEIVQKKPLFEFLESFSINQLGMPKRNKKKERIVVFFLRSNMNFDLKVNYSIKLSQLNEKWAQILKKIKFLFDEKFYKELIEILDLLQKHENRIGFIADVLIDKLERSNCLENIQVIFKNLLIQIIKEHQDELLNHIQLYQRQPDYILEVYKKQIKLYRHRIINFIFNLRCLFDNYNYDQVQNLMYQQQVREFFEAEDQNYKIFDQDIEIYQYDY
ncbi:unnamed protein product [Paramecium sonneborni]|uniref:Uncharacterized protein n=1 Tax=Paramecium sonneborni TaxID=65129 RepID=A0A8S1LZJ1_9CILI|nr:unnamed protein product [Paramecium sonneborni]